MSTVEGKTTTNGSSGQAGGGGEVSAGGPKNGERLPTAARDLTEPDPRTVEPADWHRLRPGAPQARPGGSHMGLDVRLSAAAADETAGPNGRSPRKSAARRSDAPKSIDDIKLNPRKDLVKMPSPEDWRDEVLYSVMVDRFERGEGAVAPIGDPSLPTTVHGGNIRGIIDRLDYIQGLGVSAIWVSPVVDNPEGTYHGYAPRNLLAVDKTKGTLADMRELVNEAHRRGMRIILDFVANHTCHAFDYEGDKLFSSKPKKIARWTQDIVPRELMDEKHFSRRGDISDWDNPDHSMRGDFFTDDYDVSYKSLALERPETQDIMIKVAQWWMRETGIDGFRCDAIRHIDPSFWRRFNEEVREYAKVLGKDNFLILGEAFEGDVDKLAPYLGEQWGGFSSLFNIPDYFTAEKALHGQEPTHRLRKAHVDTERAIEGTLAALTQVIDSHDLPRFLKEGESERLLEVGLTYLLTSRGLPCVYYGTEQSMRDRLVGGWRELGALEQNRTDMFPGQFKSLGQPPDSFDDGAYGYKLLASINQIRQDYPALRRGSIHPRQWDDGEEGPPGAYVFSRLHEGQEVVVVLNPSESPQALSNLWVDATATPPGTELVDALHPEYRTVTHDGDKGGAQLGVTIPPRSARILVPATPTS